MPETVTTHQREETQRLAAEVATRLAKVHRDRAAVVTLHGELGAGKTTFTQGLLAAFGVSELVTSPTFMLVHRYPLTGKFSNAYHVDAYRLGEKAELQSLGLEEALADPDNLIVVEWPEIGGATFVPTVDITFAHGATPDERTITVNWPTP